MNLPKRKSIRLQDFDYNSPQTYFITICAKDKKPYFTAETLNDKIIACLIEEKTKNDFLVYAYCLMPDHFHLLINAPGNKLGVSAFIGQFKSISTRIAWEHGICGKLWQGRFYDHILRKREDLKRIGEYILNNPARKGLVDSWQKYKYCGCLDSW